MSYSHIRYIAYHLPTIGYSNTGGVQYSLPAGLLLNSQEQQTIFEKVPDMKVAADIVNRENVLSGKPPIYMVNLSGSSQAVRLVKSDADIFSRVQRFLTVLELAASTVKYRKDLKKDGVLNLFAAPEFYFRPPEEPHSYTEQMYRAIAEVLMETIAQAKGLEHWLIIPGTIMWTKQQLDIDYLEGTSKRILIDQNTTYVINGSTALGGGQQINKYLPSSIDGLPSQRLAEGKKIKGVEFDGDWLYRAEYLKRQDIWASFSDHIVSFGGIRIGIEICRDHGILKAHPKTTGDISAQVIISCGRRLLTSHIATVMGGVVMRCDGHHGSGIRWDQRFVTRYTDIPNGSDRWDDKAKAELTPTDQDLMSNPNPFIQIDLPFNANHPLYWQPSKTVDKSDWNKYKQGLTFYFPQEV
ncbi:MAG: hypothetical protein PUP46_07805 [Endozoicomonas sp. (ex Botrylloides leachii)]|nr:hypothetical protein [Endozoicomonas sp. (ex Botrylloides leachii)]